MHIGSKNRQFYYRLCGIFVLLFFVLFPIFFSTTSFAISIRSQVYIERSLGKGKKYCSLKIKDAKRFKNLEGHCFGYSAAWLYSKWLQFVHPEKVSMYDGDWFGGTVEDILSSHWSDCDNIKKFASLVRRLQDSQFLGTFEKEMAKLDANGKKMRREYSIASLLTLDQLEDLLEKIIIYDYTLIFIHAAFHVTALFKDGESYYHYDSNDLVGEHEVFSTDSVANLIFRAHGFKYIKASPLAIKVFSFNEKIQDYLTQQEVLDSIDPVLYAEGNYAHKKTGLHLAASNGCLESARYFLDKGVKVDLVDVKDWTSLMCAAQNGHYDVALLLLERGGDPNLGNKDGWVALMLAAHSGHFEVAKLLLDNKANPNFVYKNNIHGLTPLIIASLNNYPKIVLLLIENGADPNMANKYGETAYMVAKIKGHNRIVKELRKVIEKLSDEL